MTEAAFCHIPGSPSIEKTHGDFSVVRSVARARQCGPPRRRKTTSSRALWPRAKNVAERRRYCRTAPIAQRIYSHVRSQSHWRSGESWPPPGPRIAFGAMPQEQFLGVVVVGEPREHERWPPLLERLFASLRGSMRSRAPKPKWSGGPCSLARSAAAKRREALIDRP